MYENLKFETRVSATALRWACNMWRCCHRWLQTRLATMTGHVLRQGCIGKELALWNPSSRRKEMQLSSKDQQCWRGNLTLEVLSWRDRGSWVSICPRVRKGTECLHGWSAKNSPVKSQPHVPCKKTCLNTDQRVMSYRVFWDRLWNFTWMCWKNVRPSLPTELKHSTCLWIPTQSTCQVICAHTFINL